MPERIWVVIGLGMGLESSTITKKVLRNPAAYDVDLDRLIVISAQTGLESEETKDKMEQLIYPDLAAAHIRTVQVVRAGPSEADGIVVLSDTRSPTRCYIEGGHTPWLTRWNRTARCHNWRTDAGPVRPNTKASASTPGSRVNWLASRFAT